MLITLMLLLGIALGVGGLRAYDALRAGLLPSDEARQRRDEERRLRHLTHVTMLRMLTEAREHGERPRG